ncbi:hypothetical protein L9G74_20240, partial [Shewanella sp. C32]
DITAASELMTFVFVGGLNWCFKFGFCCGAPLLLSAVPAVHKLAYRYGYGLRALSPSHELPK